jgi:hypothetical protein
VAWLSFLLLVVLGISEIKKLKTQKTPPPPPPPPTTTTATKSNNNNNHTP